MPTRIDIHNRRIVHVAVAIPRLAVRQIRDYRVRLDKSAQCGAVKSCPIIHEADICIIPLISITKGGFLSQTPNLGGNFLIRKGELLCY